MATVVSFLLFQGAFQEAETQPEAERLEPGNSMEPSFPEGSQRRFDPDRLIVSIEEDATQADLREINRENGARIEEDLPRSDVSVVDLPEDLSVREAVEVYESDPNIEYAEPDFLLRPAQTSSEPNDPAYPRLYGLNNTGQTGGTTDADIDAPEAWSATTGTPGVVVAVIDEGVDVSHPDLQNNLWVNADEVPGNGVDDDSNGYVDDVNGYDFANNDASVYDRDPTTGTGDEHGTHVAGTIAAQGNDGTGITGVSWEAQIMSLKFLGPDGGYTSDAIEALNYAVNNGATISNNSWGGGGYSQSLRDALSNASARGHLFIAAAGNGGADGIGDDNDVTPHYPSNYDLANVISVAATNSTDTLASFSNFGDVSVDLAAPGVKVYSTLPGNTYGSYSGTSMATPHVTGVAALIKSRFPSAGVAEVRTRILDSVDPQSTLTGKTLTGGRLNAAGALGTTTTPQPPEDTTPPNTGISGGPSGTTKATTASFGLNASETVQRFECSLDGATFAPCPSPKSYTGLASGSHTFRVRAVDLAGNVDATPAVRTWTVDATRPTVTSPAPRPNSGTRDRTPPIRAVVRDSQSNLQKGNVALFVDGRRVSNSAFSYSASMDRLQYVPRRNLGYGRHTVKVTATDPVGNAGTLTWRFRVNR